ncbi:hypothetical protein ACNVED_14990 (plasmid) [Legionella sp. D16C41]|uniref:hypothetical protein n=1 Tax=Legionella sp. D16C41 TaxID=3402688 RepID=UPI003AF4703C
MPLSLSQRNKLDEDYDLLENLVLPENKTSWQNNKDKILDFCVAEDIYFLDIGSFRSDKAVALFNKLIKYISFSESPPKEKLQRWKSRFQEEKEKADYEFRQLHASAYLSVADQYHKNNHVVNPQTLLTIEDMSDLLKNPDFISEELKVSQPFSLTQSSEAQDEELKKLLQQKVNIFLPVTHDGHWFYLLRDEGSWTLHDSQPIALLDDIESLTPRQESMLTESKVLLTHLTGEKEVDILLETSELQPEDNDYECGTHVINAYRKEVDEHYEALTHSEILWELLETQLTIQDFEEVPENVLNKSTLNEFYESSEELTVEEQHVVNITVSSQGIEQKAQVYGDNLKELINRVKKLGLFNHIENPIDISLIDAVEADNGETDEEFATRLQEAEYRKAGLK